MAVKFSVQNVGRTSSLIRPCMVSSRINTDVWPRLYIFIGSNRMDVMFEPSVFLAIFPYALIASFPLFGLAIVTKWVLDDRKKSRQVQQE